MTSYRPRLRSYVRVEDGTLVDELLSRSIGIEGTAAAVAARLDGTDDWDVWEYVLSSHTRSQPAGVPNAGTDEIQPYLRTP